MRVRIPPATPSRFALTRFAGFSRCALRSFSEEGQHALVAQLEERRISTPGRRGFESCREHQFSFHIICPRSSMERSRGVRSLRFRVRLAPWTPVWIIGGLAERQGTAVLTRRDLRVAQVRSLHPPPSCSRADALAGRSMYAGVAQRQSRWLPPRTAVRESVNVDRS